ncbi:centractin [Monosporozyma unispora]|nr:hypothetical protein C6P44_003602 [Kazachstania unispora]
MSNGYHITLYNQPIVFDNGSAVVKAGFSGESKPKLFEYNIVGKPKYDKVMNHGLPNDTYVGNQAQKHRGLLKLRKPMDRGMVKHWDDMELLWSHIFEDSLQLNWKSNELEEHPLLITEAPLNPEENRESMCEVLFEKFSFDALYVAPPSVLSLYANGQTSGCIIDCGDGYCSSTPIYEGFTLPSTIRRVDLGGRDLTEQLQFYIRKTIGMSLFTGSEQEIVRTIKEKAGYVALNYTQEELDYKDDTFGSKETEFKLPDGQIISLGKAKYRIPEILFNPMIIHSECDSIPTMVTQSLNLVDMDLRPVLRSNIVMSGATTMFKGFGDRLLNEIATLTPNESEIRITAPSQRKYMAWIGGSIFANSFAFKKLLLNKKSWDEDPKLVHSMFL